MADGTFFKDYFHHIDRRGWRWLRKQDRRAHPLLVPEINIQQGEERWQSCRLW